MLMIGDKARVAELEAGGLCVPSLDCNEYDHQVRRQDDPDGLNGTVNEHVVECECWLCGRNKISQTVRRQNSVGSEKLRLQCRKRAGRDYLVDADGCTIVIHD